VSKFGGILFTPIQLTAVACYASGTLKVRLLHTLPASQLAQNIAWMDSISSHMQSFRAMEVKVISLYSLRTVLSEYNSINVPPIK
jgi:hypothetical protein